MTLVVEKVEVLHHFSSHVILFSMCNMMKTWHSLNGLHPACRIVYLFAYLTAVVVYTAYSAANISFLTVQRTQLPFTDLAGLLEDGRYTLTTLGASDVPTLFKTSDDPVLRKIYKKLIKPNEASLPKTQKDGLQETCVKHTAFMMPCHLAKSLVSAIQCNTLALPSSYFRVMGAIVFPKNSTYRRIINQYITMMQTGGVFNRIERLQSREKEIEESIYSSVNMEAATPIFAVLGIGMAISAILFLLECLWFQFNTAVTMKIKQKIINMSATNFLRTNVLKKMS